MAPFSSKELSHLCSRTLDIEINCLVGRQVLLVLEALPSLKLCQSHPLPSRKSLGLKMNSGTSCVSWQRSVTEMVQENESLCTLRAWIYGKALSYSIFTFYNFLHPFTHLTIYLFLAMEIWGQSGEVLFCVLVSNLISVMISVSLCGPRHHVGLKIMVLA